MGKMRRIGESVDGATTVVPRGKLEVYKKQGKPAPEGWLLDENGSSDSVRYAFWSNLVTGLINSYMLIHFPL